MEPVILQQPPKRSKIEHLVGWYFSLFEYHAGQRIASIRIYFIVSAALISFLGVSTQIVGFGPFLGISVAIFGVFYSIIFWRLDIRNADLVEKTEDAIEILLEDYIPGDFQIKNPESVPNIIDSIKIPKNYDAERYRRNSPIKSYQYKYTLPFMFSTTIVMFSLLGGFSVALVMKIPIPFIGIN